MGLTLAQIIQFQCKVCHKCMIKDITMLYEFVNDIMQNVVPNFCTGSFSLQETVYSYSVM